MGYAGKIEIQCPEQTRGTAVILIAGQSNAANSGAQRHNTRYPDRVLNFAGGRCYVAASPLLGSNGFAGEYWTLMADQLIDAELSTISSSPLSRSAGQRLSNGRKAAR